MSTCLIYTCINVCTRVPDLSPCCIYAIQSSGLLNLLACLICAVGISKIVSARKSRVYTALGLWFRWPWGKLLLAALARYCNGCWSVMACFCHTAKVNVQTGQSGSLQYQFDMQ